MKITHCMDCDGEGNKFIQYDDGGGGIFTKCKKCDGTGHIIKELK